MSDQVGCAQNLIEQNVTGAVYPFGDWDALARLLCEFASKNVDLFRMGEIAREKIQDYSPQSSSPGDFKRDQVRH